MWKANPIHSPKNKLAYPLLTNKIAFLGLPEGRFSLYLSHGVVLIGFPVNPYSPMVAFPFDHRGRFLYCRFLLDLFKAIRGILLHKKANGCRWLKNHSRIKTHRQNLNFCKIGETRCLDFYDSLLNNKSNAQWGELLWNWRIVLP